ncbi:periplasmic binding protein-like I [Chytriomyces sp. MP71]|nr:periplasmic binding protein-like I [Chytriomyces sp. MP71]
MRLTAAMLIAFTASASAGKVYNIGFLLPYALDDQPRVWTNSSTIKFNVVANDAAAEMAVADFNSSGLLPDGGAFNIIRKNNWDPNFATNWQIVDSGGYSAIAATKMVQQNNTVAVFGDYLDSTTSFSAEVLSYFQVPFCGATQIDPTLSDKSNFQYFVRMQNGYDYGDHMLAMLALWNVTKVSIIVGPDTYSSAYGDDISSTISGNSSITVLAKLMISPEMQAASDYSYPLGVLNSANSRYFIVAADANLTADFYYAARDAELTGPDFVWLGINRPFVGDLSLQTTLYGSTAIDDLQGFVWLKDDLKPQNDAKVQSFTQRWVAANAVNASKYPLTETGSIPQYVTRAYDCAQLLMTGIMQGLKAYPDQNLQTLIANQYYQPSALANTGYDGLLHNPINLGVYGDLLTPKLVISINSSVMKMDPNLIDDGYGFGITTSIVNFTSQTAYATYQAMRPFVFPGGGDLPPNDGWIPIVPTERVIAKNSPTANAIMICSYIGHATAAIALISFLYQKFTNLQGAMPWAYGIFLIIGSEVVFISMTFWPGSESATSCIAHRYLLPCGYAISYGAVFAKLFHLSRCLQNKYERARGVSFMAVFLTVLALASLNIIFALIYQFAGQPQGVLIKISRYEFFYTCETSDPNLGNYLTYAFYVVGGVLSLGCVFYSHKLKKEPHMKVLDIMCKIAVLSGGTMIAIPFLSPQTMLPRILRAFVSWILSMGTITVAFIPQIMAVIKGKKDGEDGSDFDLGSVIKSGINRDDWSVLESGPLEVLNMGQVHYQSRGILGWSEPKLSDMIVHRRKSQLTITFSEINSFVVNAYNVSNLISEDLLDMTRNTSQGGAGGNAPGTRGDAEGGKKQDHSGMDDDSEMDERIIVITTKSFSVKVIASSSGQAAEIRAQVFGVKEGEVDKGASALGSVTGAASNVRKSTADH